MHLVFILLISLMTHISLSVFDLPTALISPVSLTHLCSAVKLSRKKGGARDLTVPHPHSGLDNHLSKLPQQCRR